MTNRLLIPGAGYLSVSPTAKLSRIAGDLYPIWMEGGRLHAAFKVGAAAPTPAETQFRQGTARLVRRAVNRKRTAAGYTLSLAEGQWFEARGYPRTSRWKRYTRKGDALISEEA